MKLDMIWKRVACLLVALILIPQFIYSGEKSAYNAYVEGSVWEITSVIDDRLHVVRDEKDYFDGTRVLNGHTYLDMYSTGSLWNTKGEELDSSFSSVRPEEPIYQGAVRTEDGKVYFVPPNYEKEFLLFDFNLKESEETEVYPFLHPYENGEPDPVRIRCVRSTEFIVGNDVVKILEVGDMRYQSDVWLNTWICGLGSAVGPLENLYAWYCGGGGTVNRITVNGKEVYRYSPAEYKHLMK
ncbi:MAG: hypothetical protein HDS87_00865 [Bacteroidales bacterium]|nr:hypothetical protein [Bacteroidales bacterium]